ncbi:MAG: hypothetical protein JNK82_17345 [Myxococcaceae bacterium]|nr:hypothetical protein [Myxococcaceae bacterium]
MLAVLPTLVLAGSVSVEPVNPQALIFYNARVALREHKANEALKLWLLRNVVARDERHVGRFDEDLRSVTWAALGSLGLCGDGFPKDDAGGAGLWPVAVHNEVVSSLTKGSIPTPQNPFDALDAKRQARRISLHDVLDPAELRTVTFFRTACLVADTTMVSLNKPLLSVDLSDRLATAPVMRQLLLHALETLDRSKVESTAVIEARIFDIDLAMVQLAERKARQKALAEKAAGRRTGLSEVAIAENAEAARQWPKGSRQYEVLQKTLTWNPDEWLTLSQERRQFLFAQAKPLAATPEGVEALALGITDRLAARGQGSEVEDWLGFLELKGAPVARRSVVTSGDRGKQLLALEPASGFRERAVIALHRGVSSLESGNQLEALRSFGYAMAHAEESREAQVVLPLARRWLSYVLSRYTTNGEVLGTLRALVPRQELNAVFEDLLWRAALRADERSFETIAASVQRGSSLDARIAKLKPVAKGDAGAFATQLRDAAAEEPHFTLRFLRTLLEKIEAEDADVRIANVPMLKALTRVLDFIATSSTSAKSQMKTADELRGRVQGILDGLAQFDTTEQGRQRSLGLRYETFAGNIRIAPSDPLPWPFSPPTVAAASVFVPLKLEPLEWKTREGQLVFGWRVTE